MLKDIFVNGIYRLLADKYQLNDSFFMVGFGLCMLICVAAGYLLGSINSAIIVSEKKYGTDIRSSGSGNAGMTNMFRTFGKTGGLLTLAGDALKTAAAVLIGYLILGHDGAYVAGLFCVTGHVFPLYYKFRGGKGVLAAGIMMLLCDWPVFLMLILVFAVILVGTKIVSMASVMAAFMLPLFVDIWYRIKEGTEGAGGIRVLMAMLVTVIVVTKHIPNMKRIYAGEEPKIRLPWEKKKENEAGGSSSDADEEKNEGKTVLSLMDDDSAARMKKSENYSRPDKNTSKKKKKRR
ncbi:MAG: glycerol-3-phosphate 1-O-acyltransferase PlsY [Clostridia bacterium]|nr:glycerol-3-phosphate 1-O-acyltransferase PlsY [Clostridia bacterium]